MYHGDMERHHLDVTRLAERCSALDAAFRSSMDHVEQELTRVDQRALATTEEIREQAQARVEDLSSSKASTMKLVEGAIELLETHLEKRWQEAQKAIQEVDIKATVAMELAALAEARTEPVAEIPMD